MINGNAAPSQFAADAVAMYRAILARQPDAASVWVDLAAALLADGQREGALTALDRALEHDASLARGWLLRGEICQSLHDFTDAIRAFAQAERLGVAGPALLIARATAHAELDELAAAETWLRRALALDPDCVAALANLSSVYLRLGRLDLAEMACRDALAQSPNLVVAHQNLAGILTRRGAPGARFHRDAAYRRRQIFIEPSARPTRTALILCVADEANVPLRDLLPREHCTLIKWFIEYAPPDQESQLPAYDFVFNAIGEADFALAGAARTEEFVAKCKRPLLNHPARIARTGRADLPHLLNGIANLKVPAVTRAEVGADYVQAARDAGIVPPLILRPSGAHGGNGVRRIGTWNELAACGEAETATFLTEFIDSRGPDALFRKYRVIFVDRIPYAYHLAISRDWLVHYWTAGMERHADRRAEEDRFISAPAVTIGAAALQTLAEIAKRLDLDYAGADFTILPDGRVLLFEANATMLVHREADPLFAYKNPAVQRICAAFDGMVEARLQAAL